MQATQHRGRGAGSGRYHIPFVDRRGLVDGSATHCDLIRDHRGPRIGRPRA